MSRITIEEVTFDATNVEHLKAFEMQVLGVKQPNGSMKHTQHPSLRFKLEKPFTSVNTMMIYKVGKAYISQFDI